MKLINWYLKGSQLIGQVTGSEKYEDGSFVHTSTIVTAMYDDGLFLFRTENSIYECLSAEFSGTVDELTQVIAGCTENNKQTTRVIR
ncbi:MAG: hypothetical protein UHN88_04475 [Eubacterium sp.]|nr:hypothetical protein [Eubacterium sp.]